MSRWICYDCSTLNYEGDLRHKVDVVERVTQTYWACGFCSSDQIEELVLEEVMLELTAKLREYMKADYRDTFLDRMIQFVEEEIEE